MASTRGTFENQDPTKGNFRAYMNLLADDEDNIPSFTGFISLPGEPDKERGFALRRSFSKRSNNLILRGYVTPGPDDQRAKLNRRPGDPNPDATKFVVMQEGQDPFPIKPHYMILFTSPNTEPKEGKKAPPKMFGYYNPGGDKPVQVISGFEHLDKNGKIMLLGPVEAYDPDKSYDQQLEALANGRDEDEDEPEIDPSLSVQKQSGKGRPVDEGPHR